MSETPSSHTQHPPQPQQRPTDTAITSTSAPRNPIAEVSISKAQDREPQFTQPSLSNPLHHPTNSSSTTSLQRTHTSLVSATAHGATTPLRALPTGLYPARPLNHSRSQPFAISSESRDDLLRRSPLVVFGAHPTSAVPTRRSPGSRPADAVTARRAITSPNLTHPILNESSSGGQASYGSSMDQQSKSASQPNIASHRNPSLDSAMSSVSSATSAAPSILSQGTSHSYHSSSETTVTSSTPPDAASLVTQAGNNPKAVIETLLKENKSLSSRNEQLWRLVEKQRSMVHGLHADLERALKDKEKYRRRLKEYQQEPVPAIPPHATLATEAKEAAHIDGHGADTDATTSGPSSKLKATAPKSPLSPRSPRGVPHQLAPSQDSTISNMTASGFPGDYSDAQAPVGLSSNPTSSLVANHHQQKAYADEKTQHAPQRSPATPKSVQEKSSTGTGEKLRKSAPAPLNLSQSARSPPAKDPLEKRNSESDYGDDDDVDGASLNISRFDRGRRRTREDDDREREEVAMAEEARSRSEKSKKSKSKHKCDAEEPEATSILSVHPTSVNKEGPRVAVGLPSSPRAALSQNHLAPGMPEPADSIASILAPPEPSAVTREITQSATLPPKSPGLPMSPKPSDRPANAPLPRAPGGGLASPGPLSPRQGLPLSPRAPKYPIPLPGNSSGTGFPISPTRPNPDLSITTSMAERMQADTDVPSETRSINANSPSNEIYRGFVSEKHPNLLITPGSLPAVIVKVWSCRLRPPTHHSLAKGGDDDVVFTLGVHSRSNDKQLWRLEKKPTSLSALEWSLRKFVKLKVSHPDRSIFSGHAPAKLDARRAALNRYFEAMLDLPMDEKPALLLCDYLTKYALPPEEHSDLSAAPDEPNSPASPKAKPRKEGYLAKKGKQFGGWKSRYFVLENSHFKHYESPTGNPLGIIKLQQAQIARPNSKDDLDEDDEFRHAFTILEPKKKDSTSHVRHVLCAESDEERDAWVEALIQHIGGPHPFVDSPPSSPRLMQSATFAKSSGSFESTTRKPWPQDISESLQVSGITTVPYEDTTPLDAPRLGTPTSNLAPTPSPLPDDHSSSDTQSLHQHPTISGPVAGGPIQNAHMWGNKSPSPTRAKDREMKKRSVFGFMRSTLEEPQSSHGGRRGLSPRPPISSEKIGSSRAIFGTPLAEAAEYSQPTGVNICIPSPIYRCIEYLEFHHAADEEGIFRLSGSNTVIRSLRERFDTGRDVNLVEGPYIDIHAVASLLKLYLRELPDTVLTRDKLVDFQKVLEVDDRRKRLAAVNLLVHQLPEANREVLVALSRYLIKVVNNSEHNRMTLKNVGIVFAPTLNIPTPLVFLFITEYDSVFTAAPADPDAASPVLEDIATFKAENPNSALSLPLNQMRTIASATENGEKSPTVQQRIEELHQHSPKTSQNSFSDHLAEQRHQLQQSSGIRAQHGTPIPPFGSSRNAPFDTNVLPQRSHSPSPAPGGYKMHPSSSRGTPPPDGVEAYRNEQTRPLPGSSSSSPNSLTSSIRGRDSPMNGTTMDNSYASTNAAATTSRKARRESALLGGFGLEPGTPEGAKRKSSYTRLRENLGGNSSLREE